jgi:cytochrome c551
MTNRSVWIVSFLTLVLGACSSSSSSTADPARAQSIMALSIDMTSGKTLFTTNCASCHGADGKSGSVGRDVAAIAAGSGSKAVNTMLAGEGEMPSFSDLDNQSLADILGYLQSL